MAELKADVNIEGLLRTTAAATTYPPAPDVRQQVVRRIAAGELELAHPRTDWRRIAFAGLMVAVVAVLVALAVTPSREAIARFFGVQGSRIEVVPAGSIAMPLPQPTLAPIGGPVFLIPLSAHATEASLTDIEAETGFSPALPAGASQPPRSLLVRYGNDRAALLEYADFDVWQARLEDRATFGKMIEAGSIFLEVTVGAQPAVWLSGTPHIVEYYDRNGHRIEQSARVVDRSTLIWRTDHAFYRIETSLPLEEALRIAVTLP